jgi:hypothetical protein
MFRRSGGVDKLRARFASRECGLPRLRTILVEGFHSNFLYDELRDVQSSNGTHLHGTDNDRHRSS